MLTSVYEKPYSHYTSHADLMDCKKNDPPTKWVLVGGYHKDAPNKLILACFGETDKVLAEEDYATKKKCELNHNGAFWYKVKK